MSTTHGRGSLDGHDKKCDDTIHKQARPQEDSNGGEGDKGGEGELGEWGK